MTIEYAKGAEVILPNGVMGWCVSDPKDGKVKVLLLGLYRRTVPLDILSPLRIQELKLDGNTGGWVNVNPEDYYFKAGDTIYLGDEESLCKILEIDYTENYLEVERHDGLTIVSEIEEIHPARCRDGQWEWQDIDCEWIPIDEEGLPESDEDDQGNQNE